MRLSSGGKPNTHLSAGESLGKLSFPSLPPEMAPHSDPSKGFIWAINGGEYLLFTLFAFYFVKECSLSTAVHKLHN